jgi:uncharacterized protein
MENLALNQNEVEIIKQTLIFHQVSKAYFFGSVLTSSFNPSLSDLDILVEMDEKDPLKKGEKLLSLWDSLEKKLDRKVDLLTFESIKNPILSQEIERTKKIFYDRSEEKVGA